MRPANYIDILSVRIMSSLIMALIHWKASVEKKNKNIWHGTDGYI